MKRRRVWKLYSFFDPFFVTIEHALTLLFLKYSEVDSNHFAGLATMRMPWGTELAWLDFFEFWWLRGSSLVGSRTALYEPCRRVGINWGGSWWILYWFCVCWSSACQQLFSSESHNPVRHADISSCCILPAFLKIIGKKILNIIYISWQLLMIGSYLASSSHIGVDSLFQEHHFDVDGGYKLGGLS